MPTTAPTLSTEPLEALGSLVFPDGEERSHRNFPPYRVRGTALASEALSQRPVA